MLKEDLGEEGEEELDEEEEKKEENEEEGAARKGKGKFVRQKGMKQEHASNADVQGDGLLLWLKMTDVRVVVVDL